MSVVTTQPKTTDIAVSYGDRAIRLEFTVEDHGIIFAELGLEFTIGNHGIIIAELGETDAARFWDAITTACEHAFHIGRQKRTDL